LNVFRDGYPFGDEFQMVVCPVVVGSGKRFFPDGLRLDLELVVVRAHPKPPAKPTAVWITFTCFAVPDFKSHAIA
jgi:dihydrofolate reductase